MKFARYLQDTQIPEWKRAYIDYRGLKKRISAIRKASEITESMSQEDLPQVQSHNEARTPSPVENAPGPSHLGVATSTSSWHAREPLSPGTTSIRSKILKKASWSLPKSPANNPRHPFTAPLSMPELLPLLSQQELDFFTALDAELEKIESFYLDREGEMADRTKTLEAQFQELSVHQQRFQALYAGQARPWFLRKLRWNAFAPKQTKTLPENLRRENVHSDPSALRLFLDQEEYQTAKKQLKKAVVEHYRGLEALKNYRILNITGIRKALKKFEKTTKIPALQSYMSEKVDTSAFALDTTLNILMKTMEDMYASRFVRGDRKRAMARLRVGPQQRKTHHASAFRAGMLFGTACPAFAAGLYQSFQVETRQSISGWDTLLFIYGILSIPVLFSCLVGLNLSIWARARINYVFIFELEARSRLDHREYFELPSVILCTFCYSFWLAFSRIGAPHLAPDIWPLIWLAFVALLLVNPLPIMSRQSRLWLLKRTGQLLLSGTRRVDFADFWLGDQYCSFVFTLSQLPLLVCSYANGFEGSLKKCGSSARFWPVMFLLATLPFFVRVVQSIKRYVDSGLSTHLVNGGKYLSGIVAYLVYFIWRHQGGHGASFVLWCVLNTIYAIYASSWDLLMDWSVLRMHAEHKLLRPELIYVHQIPLYYFAIISNVLIRFIWIIYIPTTGPSVYVRTFLAGTLEMLRRIQWNFYRLENEHLGNMDQYRITREVPLPYAFDDTPQEDVDDEDEDQIR